jgi:hypothetical protein
MNDVIYLYDTKSGFLSARNIVLPLQSIDINVYKNVGAVYSEDKHLSTPVD